MIRSNHISQEWINVDFMRFVEEGRIIWDSYISILSHSHAWIRDYEDKIIWQKNRVGVFLPKGTLVVIIKIYFQFLWMGDKNKINFPFPCKTISFQKD